MLVIGAFYDGVYKALLVAHILCAIIGFGAVFLNALYGNEVKKHRGPEGIAIFDANHKVSMIGEYFIYAVPIFGIALIFSSDDVWKFSQTWVWLSLLIYVVALGVSHAVLMPTLRRMRVLMGELAGAPPPGAAGGGPGAAGGPPAGPPPQAIEMQQLGKKLGVVGPFLNLSLIVVLILMVWKPGV